MEKHFNLFQSYNSGHEKDLVKVVQLEDNITRALLCVLSNLDLNLQHTLLSQLIPDAFLERNEIINYDLQNPSTEIDFMKRKKIMITIQRTRCKLNKNSLVQDPIVIEKLLKNYDNATKQKIKTILINAYGNWEELKSIDLSDYGMNDVKLSMFSSILNLIGENRADGWIITNQNVVLIEAKIGYNEVSPYQLYRHLTKENGFKIKYQNIQQGESCPDYCMQHLTWNEIYSILESSLTDAGEKDKFLLSEYLKYLAMNGEKLDLSFILKNEKINPEIYKSQFELFLSEFDRKVRQRDIPLRRGKRPKDYLWDYYGLPDTSGEVLKHPHYSISFQNNKIYISLTTNNKSQILNVEIMGRIKDYFKNIWQTKSPVSLAHYFVGFVNYRIADWKTGQIKGENFDTFKLYAKLSEIKNEIDDFFNMFPIAVKFQKQFEFGLEIDFLNFSKIKQEDDSTEQLRVINRNLLQNPDNLNSYFIDFINETFPIFLLMAKIKKIH